MNLILNLPLSKICIRTCLFIVLAWYIRAIVQASQELTTSSLSLQIYTPLPSLPSSSSPSSSLLRTQRKRHIPRRRTPHTRTTKTPRRTCRSRCTHTALPTALTNINSRARIYGLERKQCGSARSGGRCWGTTAFDDRASYAAADS